ncbi:MAG: cellulase family glycosylhydrolase, partial [Bacteroidales bacterium]|nr:cellulase family glycosylhydrolase [Bacteroidales bacterium]
MKPLNINFRHLNGLNLIILSIVLICPANFNTLNAACHSGDSIVADLQEFCSSQKGFNLLGKFDVSWSNKGFSQGEFSMIHELGFNFVRLPLDYRTYTQSGNWDVFLETEVQEIDKAVQWGQQYNVHVCLNLHRAPGYCVNSATLPANQQLNLWTDTLAQKAFVNHWEYFADRYKDISPGLLSFNLVNEPSNVSGVAYLNVMLQALDAIRAISPERIVFIDGLEYGRILIPELKDLPYVAQAIHCYDPFGITHYKADWVNGSDNWPVPHWPVLWVSNYLYGPWKNEYKSPLVIQGNFETGTRVIVNVRQVSVESTLQIKAGQTVIYSKKFVCGADTGADFSQIVNTEWGYQNISNKDFNVTLAAPATSISLENVSGDWMTVNSITIHQGDKQVTLVLSNDSWGEKQSTYVLENGKLKTTDGEDLLPFGTYQENVEIAREHNIPFMVQEFGVYNKTPYPVTIAFLSDLMDFFRENNIGWALWNFNGSFGILNSGRTDCPYESWNGYKLDRAMLDVLNGEETVNVFHPEGASPISIFP